MSLRSFAPALALSLLACRGSPPVPTPADDAAALRPQVQALSDQARALLKAQDELIWKGWTEGANVDVAKTYEGKEALFSPQSVKQISQLKSLSADPLEQRALLHLKVHFAGEHLAQALAEVSGAIANVEAGATIELDGKEFPYRNLDRLLANEKSTERRRALYAGGTKAVERISQSVIRKEKRVKELLGELGYPSYEAFSAELRSVDVDALAALANQVLNATEAAHEKVIGELARKELQLSFKELTRSDFPRLFRPNAVDDLFPKDKLLTTLNATALGLGIDPAALPNVRIDSKDTAKKNPRALTLPVEIPGDVRMSLKPFGGVKDWSASTHELGHALHYGLAGELRWELTKLGNPTVAEAYGYLFEDLLDDPVWLEQNVGLSGDRQAEYLASTSAYRLHELRRAAGALLYSIESHRREEVDPKALYAELFEQTYGIKPSPEEQARYLVDREDFLASSDRMLAWFLAGQLQGQLKVRFGPTWWKNPEAGAFLRSLWTHGNSKSADEIARLAGEPGIRPDVLLLRLATTLKVSIPLGRGGP